MALRGGKAQLIKVNVIITFTFYDFVKKKIFPSNSSKILFKDNDLTPGLKENDLYYLF